MINFSLKQILGFSAAFWAVFVWLSFVIPPEEMFHFLNPASIALGTVLVIIFSSGIIDAWKNCADGITLAHLLTFGVTLNWLGMILRMGRWYITGKHPSVSFDAEFWTYNLGLWISIWAGLFLAGAGTLAVKEFRFSTLFVIFMIVFGFLFYLGYADIPKLHEFFKDCGIITP